MYLESYKKYLAARITSAKLRLKNLRLPVMNVYALKNVTHSESTKTLFNAESILH